jgi:hypothetical protein
MKIAILSVAFAVSLAAVGDTPTFVPQNRAVVKRTLTMKGTRDLVSEAQSFGDQQQTNPNPYRKVDLNWKYVVTDTYDKVAGERVDRLKRTYDSLAESRAEKAKDQKGADVSKAVDKTFGLEGKTVTFAWDEAKGSHVASFEDDSDKELLKDLVLDMDYREFLPQGEVKPGDKWVRDFADVKLYLLRPGGDMPFQAESPTRALDLRARAAVWDGWKGKVEFELKPTTGEGAERVSTIHFTGSTSTDAATDAVEGEKGPARIELHEEQTFEGDLVWDMHQNRARSIEWASKGTMMLRVHVQAQAKTGEAGTLVQAQTFDTAYDYAGSFEAQ